MFARSPRVSDPSAGCAADRICRRFFSAENSPKNNSAVRSRRHIHSFSRKIARKIWIFKSNWWGFTSCPRWLAYCCFWLMRLNDRITYRPVPTNWYLGLTVAHRLDHLFIFIYFIFKLQLAFKSFSLFFMFNHILSLFLLLVWSWVGQENSVTIHTSATQH